MTSTPYDNSLGVETATIYRMDAAGVNPVDLIADIVPSYTDSRAVLDLINSEQWNSGYEVTDNVLQDFRSVQSNSRKMPETVSIQGLLINSLALEMVGSVGVEALTGFSGAGVLRTDITRYSNLKAIADEREPVLVATPIGSMLALIENISASWDTENGESLNVSIQAKQVRISSPNDTSLAIPDLEESYTGNNSVRSVGEQSPNNTNVTASESGVTGVPPSV